MRYCILVFAAAAACTLLAIYLSEPPPPKVEAQAGGNNAALKAFDTVYKVMTHPRCMNCHPTGNSPLVGDESTPHLMDVVRGEADFGAPGMRCMTCHHNEQVEAENMPPGVSGAVWHIAMRNQAFEGKTKRQLAAMLRNPRRSLFTGEELVEHVEHDALIRWAWNPGPGRTPAPGTHDEFVEAFKTWVNAGMPLPAASEEE